MATGILYRPGERKNAHGDAVDADGNVVRVGSASEVGPVHGLVIGGPNWQPTSARGDVVDTSGLVGVPVSELVQPRHGDLLVVDGVRYAIKGPPQWSHTSVLTGSRRRYRWWLISAASN
ncbi:hypothetical protein [Mycolicibacterium mengxianglii]|uniref:hypothetical protein n=1 Tax=Mycolicibacterium mengxianglii TaxID=2736649 RepID=UPI0018D0F7E4|nr:hypothetical protein [Mycolicibacterium mengxianglii]